MRAPSFALALSLVLVACAPPRVSSEDPVLQPRQDVDDPTEPEPDDDELVDGAPDAFVPGSNGPITSLRLSVGVARESPLSLDELFVGVLWRTGCAACSYSMEDPVPPPEVRDLEASRLAFQPLTVAGDFPSDFTVSFAEPPSFILDTAVGYPTGVIVFATSPDGAELQRQAGFGNVGFSYPVLLDGDAALLPVVSMTPFYVGFKTVENGASDNNLTERAADNDGVINGAVLAPGFHAARHNGVAINASLDAFICHNELVPTGGICPAEVDPLFEGVDVLETDQWISFTVGGAEDFIGALRGVSMAALPQ